MSMVYNCRFCGKDFKVKREVTELLRVCPQCKEIHSDEVKELRKESNRLKRKEKEACQKRQASFKGESQKSRRRKA